MCCGIDENAVGACSELVFAPIDEMFPDDAPLLPSGFRIIPLDSKSVELELFLPDLSIPSFLFEVLSFSSCSYGTEHSVRY